MSKTDDLAKLEAELAKTLDNIATFRQEIAPWQAKLEKGWKLRETLIERIASLKLSQMADGEIDWTYLLEADTGMTRYRAGQKAIESIGLSSFGYNPQTNQTCINLRLTKGDPASLAKTLNGLKIIIPHLKPNDEGKIYLGILEHTLSADGKFELYMDSKTNECELSFFRYHRQTKIAPFANLLDALTYIQENAWYVRLDKNGKLVDEDEDEDED